MGRGGVLQEGDELLEVGGVNLIGLSHEYATFVVMEIPVQVSIVVCRFLPTNKSEDEGGMDSHLTATCLKSYGRCMTDRNVITIQCVHNDNCCCTQSGNLVI